MAATKALSRNRFLERLGGAAVCLGGRTLESYIVATDCVSHTHEHTYSLVGF